MRQASRRISVALAKRLRRLRDQSAQDMVEYALLTGFVTVMATALFPAVSKPLRHIAHRVAQVLAATGAAGTAGC